MNLGKGKMEFDLNKKITIDASPDKVCSKGNPSKVESHRRIQLDPPPTLKRKADEEAIPPPSRETLDLPDIKHKTNYFKQFKFILKNKQVKDQSF